MWIHHDTDREARTHLTENSWKEIKNGAWVSKDGTCKATIHPVTGTEKVAICYRIKEGGR